MGIHMIKRASAVFAAAALALTGCSGEDGDPGAKGSDGTSCTVTNNGDGTSTVACTDGTTATIENGTDGTDAQSCLLTSNGDGTRTLTCPDGSTVVLETTTLAGKVQVTEAFAAVDGGDVILTYKVTLNGVANNAFTNKAGGHRYAGATSATAIRTGFTSTELAATTVTAGANGSYTVRIPGMATTVGSTPTTFMVRLNTGTTAPQATVVAHLNSKPKSTVSDQACINCHGDNVFHAGIHHSANPQGAGACVVCHTRADSSETRLGTATNLTTGVVGTAPGTRLMGYVHGIHNSHNMPDHVYSRNGSTSASSQFSIGFPSYMQNCSTCHDTQENLDLVLSKPVSYQTCISCHDGWDGFSFSSVTAAPYKDTHATFTAATNCASCHDGGMAPAKVEGYHGKRQAYTPRNGLLYDGKDQSIEAGKRVAMTIDSITRDDSDPAAKKLVVTWSATLDGTAVDPCNTDVAAGPVFMDVNAANSGTGLSTSNMTFLQAYAQGNDWVSAGIGTAPGQPITSPTLRTVSFTPTSGSTAGVEQPANTVCADNVATSIVPAATTTATKGVLGLQGKPQVTFTSTTRTGTPYTRIIQVRSPSPTREFVTATGAEPAAADKRRAIADSAKCLTCHQGSMYQHGGNRVDSVDLCVICHNPAANEKNVRVGLFVDADEAYDGQPGQTYDLRYMLHAIHSAGKTNAPLVYYRSNGIYAFGSEAAIANLAATKNWPGAGSKQIYGSQTSASDTTPVTRTHNEIVVHYPRALNDCAACHVSDAGSVALPSTSKAVAVTTYDAGAAPWSNQLDDVLMSPATASCMSCHQSGDIATQGALRAHAFQNSWTPAVFTGGRADILGGAASESCLLCHGAGRVSDFNAKHGGGH
jgi:OmcA/MtrC family decaheme c-type cytochrome